jgi:hypothetical protein
MQLIQNITSQPLQEQTLILTTGSPLLLQLYYRPVQQGWFINTLTYLTFTLNGMRVTNQLNMLRQWKNILPFGLACISASNREPSLIADFSSGASNLYILSAAEVQEYEALLNGG